MNIKNERVSCSAKFAFDKEVIWFDKGQIWDCLDLTMPKSLKFRETNKLILKNSCVKGRWLSLSDPSRCIVFIVVLAL